eukprot:7086473-Alexandrium_andersonii.AAC.1
MGARLSAPREKKPSRLRTGGVTEESKAAYARELEHELGDLTPRGTQQWSDAITDVTNKTAEGKYGYPHPSQDTHGFRT